MSTEETSRSCIIALHDDRLSTEDVLCGVKVLPLGRLAYLSVLGAKRLCIISKALASHGHEISIHVALAQRFGLENRSQGTLQLIEDHDTATATHVELFFRDQYLSRADMWRMMSTVDSSVVFRGQKLHYLGGATAKVDAIYISGKQVESALVTSTRTKPIFRSGSARYTILVQISKAMLEYWNDGDIMYERLLTGFLPDLFRRWEHLKVRHTVSVVIFGRTYEQDEAHDFFQVIASDVSSNQWQNLLRKLKLAINDAKLPRLCSLAAQGNMLEAIHMAAMDFASEDVDPFLSTTGSSIIAITANAGLFETTHDMLKCTTLLLMGNGIGVDIVALSPKPLHPVPLFSYEWNGAQEFALPHWVDISYWNDQQTEKKSSKWLLQDLPGDVENISLPAITSQTSIQDPLNTSAAMMNTYDDRMFSHSASASPSHPQQDAIDIPTKQRPLSIIKDEALATTITRSDIEKSIRDKRSAEPKSKPSSTQGSLTTVKKATLPPHPLMQIGRKISVGPKGLAPGRSVASTTISIEHAAHGKDLTTHQLFTPDEMSSGLAKQIRQSLARKPSYASFTSHSTSEQVTTSKPIDIQSSHDEDAVTSPPPPLPSDPAALIERNVLGTLAEGSTSNGGSLSATPKARQYAVFGPNAVSVNDEAQWTMSPWVTLLNPCNPKRENMRVATQYRKWQHVFPRAISSGAFKWASMCSPASLPLTTEYRPSPRALEKHCAKKLRRILVSPDAKGSHEKAHRVMEQLIALRLSHGFQLPASKLKPIDAHHIDDNDPILMSLGGIHHELQCLSGAEIQIVEYTPLTAPDRPEGDDEVLKVKYHAHIKAAIARRGKRVPFQFSTKRWELDWSQLDDQVASHDGSSVDEGGYKMRMVLIPVDPPTNGYGRTSKELSDEERRIDGIQRLTQLWQRNRYFTPEDMQRQASLVWSKTTPGNQARDPNPLAIEYQTRDPSAVVNAYGPSLTGQLTNAAGIPPLFGESELYHTSTFDVAKLVKQMQDPPPHGVEVRDRRWFTQLHLKCFRGDEMVNWLVRVFRDVQTREDAVVIGNELMRRGVFSHVRHKHDFRDGNYFYQITSAHRTTEYPDTASMFTKGLRSIPSTPATDFKGSPMLKATTNGSSDSSGRETPTGASSERKQLLLSEKMQCNVDPSGKSGQLEVVNLHYDRIHNPENCYHIQLDWTNTTVKLIRDAITRWSALVDHHGLKLVQVPLAEAIALHHEHPFDQAVSVKLILDPPDNIPATPFLDPHSFTPRVVEDALSYQKALLRKMDFVLDLESASSFMTKLDVSYSWGRPEYELTQFVHKSGLVLAQIAADDRSDFLVAPNRLTAHPAVRNLTATAGAGSAGNAVSGRPGDAETAEQIVQKFTAFCRDRQALAAFYEDLSRTRRPLGMSPFTPATFGAIADHDIPPMSLPPHLTHRAMLKGL